MADKFISLHATTCLPVPGVDPDPELSDTQPIGQFVRCTKVGAEYRTTTQAPFTATTKMVSEEPIRWA